MSDNKNGSKILSVWGALISVSALLIGVGISYGVANRTMQDHERRIESVEKMLKEDIPAMRDTLTEIKTLLKVKGKP